MIQLTVTDTLQNFTNGYVFQTQEDMTIALHMLLDFADYSEESVKNDIYFAGAKLDGDKLLTNGGRVLGVTSVGERLESVIKASYEKVSKIHFDNSFYRHDIGARALKAKEGK